MHSFSKHNQYSYLGSYNYGRCHIFNFKFNAQLKRVKSGEDSAWNKIINIHEQVVGFNDK